MEMNFYLHDLCTVRAVSDELISEICHVDIKGGEVSVKQTVLGITIGFPRDETIRDVLAKHLKGKLFLCDFRNCDITLQSGKVTLVCYGGVRLPFSYLKEVFPRKELKVSTYATLHDPVITLRYQKLLMEEFERTKLYDNLQELLGKIGEYIS